MHGSARERIIDAATTLFSNVPVEMTTINAIAREAGVKQPLLMYHFKTKESLYHEVLMLTADRWETILREYFDEFDRKEFFQKEEAKELLAGIIRTLIDGMGPNRERGVACLRIVLFEVCFPSDCFQELYERFFSRFYVMTTGLVMAINDRFDYETAVLQWMQIFGLIVSHQVEKEIVRRFTGFKGESLKEREKLKERIVRNAFQLLEAEP